MAIVNRTTLKSYFETGDRPTQGQFANLIDSAFNLAEDQSVGQGWQVDLLRNDFGDDVSDGALMIFPAPLNTNSVSSLRLFGSIGLDAGETDADLDLILWYLSDIQIPGLASVDNGDGLFIHKVIGGPDPVNHFEFTQFTTTGVFDETLTPLQSFQFNDYGLFYFWCFPTRGTISYQLVGLEYS